MSRWLSLRRRKTRNRPNSVASSITKSFPKGLAFLSEPEDANVDIVFIHDLTQGRDEAWASVDPADGWPARLSEQGLDKARLVTFGYDVGDVQRIGELFDPSKLRESAEKLLHYYPLHTGWVSQANGATNGTAEAAVNGTNGVNGINGANGANGVNGHGDGHNEATAEEHAPAPVGIERPVIFVAHGFGGLIYEQAVALSFEKDQGVGKRRKHASVLLNTPHHGPGIAEWAVICAKELGIPCASSAQLEDWPPFEESIEKLRIIQRLFREAIRQKKSDLHITGAYGTLPTANKLKLASEWASLPDFESIAVEETHFGLTSLRADGEGFKKIASFIVKNASELSTAAADEASAEAAAAEERRLSETTFDRHRDAAAAIIALGLEATKPLAALFNSPQKHSKFMVAYVSKKLEYLLNAFEFLGLQLNKYEAASEERALEDLHLALETCRDSILKLQSETEDFGDISGTDQELQALSDQSGVLDSLIIPVVGDLRRGLDGILDKLLSVSPQTDSSEATLRKQFIKLRRESTHVQDLGARLSTYLPADKLLELEAKATEPSQTLLHCAARSGDVLAVEVLVDMGSNINSRDGEQQTPLHHASQRGDILTVGILLDRGASVEAQDVQGLRPLHLAASKGAGNVVELLLQKGADKDAPDSRARVPLHWAAENNHEAVVQQLIFAKASLGAGDKNARTSLHLAVEYQSEGVAQQLIRANAPIDALDRWSSTPLHIAAQKNSHAVIQQLFQAKASIDAKDQYQRTPLHWAAFRGFEKILTALLEKKADLEAVDSEGHTALQLAVIQGYAGIVQTLLGAGAVKEAQGTAGSVPLHEAISRGYIVLARMLLDDGADIEAKDKNGLTPLRAAMSRGQRDMVNLLVGKGANMDVKDN